MPFELLEVDTSPEAGVPGLSVALLKGKRDLVTRMIIYVTEKVCEKLAWPVGTPLEVHLGTGADHGLLRLRKNVNIANPAVVREVGKGKFNRIEIALGHVPGFVDRAEPKVPCKYEVLEHDFVEVVLPEWAQETHPTKPKVAVPPPAPRPAVVVERRPVLGRRVTVPVNFGDPPRERSALVQGAAARRVEQQRLEAAEKEARTASEKISREERRAEPKIPARRAKAPASVSLSPAMRSILVRLSDGEVHTLEDLYRQMGSSASSTQIVRTTVSMGKGWLQQQDITVTAVPGVGYKLEEPSLGKVRAYFEGALA